MERFGMLRAALIASCSVLVVACGDKPAPEVVPPPPAAADRGTIHVVVQPGQTLDTIAHAVRVPKRDIIAVNHLVPPYALKAGATLEIPGGAAKTVAKAKPAAKPHVAAEPSAKPMQTAKVAAPPRSTKAKNSAPEIIPLD